jgi:hypothetical protein
VEPFIWKSSLLSPSILQPERTNCPKLRIGELILPAMEFTTDIWPSSLFSVPKAEAHDLAALVLKLTALDVAQDGLREVS